jgi:hypothetical protein
MNDMTNFDHLSNIAYNRETLKAAEREDLENLWTAFFKLENWIFIVDASKNPANTNPFIGFIEERPWLFAFTDSKKAHEFGKKFGLLDKNNDCLFLSLTPDAARKMIAGGSEQIDGVRINEGAHGWFSPTENIESIYEHLKRLAKL